ncbi:MAG: YbhB/YbcL family Raf kinase inhibitor-like protein [candidate division NC10 bacterium]|nr:YbhB/YbcL family Raf kinase inhibitor-like protein [candidate division NC10 bacterium]
MELQLRSSAFEPGGMIPKQYTCDGPDISPPLRWTDPPPGTKSLALICDDPDAPVGTWVHWVLYGLTPEIRELPEGVPTQPTLPGGGKQGRNDFRKIGYGGPCPPKGPAHRYFFKLYALNAEPALGPGATKQELLNAMANHILAQAELMGRYRR